MAIDHDGSTPLYLQIRDALQGQIESGAYADGARLPSERDLAEAFGVSRMTARQAIQLLTQEGLISTRIGKGTFVQHRAFAQTLHDLTSFSDDMRKVGVHSSSRVLRAEVGAADVDTAAHLDLAAGDEIVRLDRVRLADGLPIALERAHIRHAICPGILEASDFSRQSLYAALKETYGVRLVWASEVIAARMPDSEEREALGITDDVPVLSLKRVTHNERDEPVEYVRSSYHSERYQFRTVLREDARLPGFRG